MIIIDDIEQGSAAWHLSRSGVVSASRAAEFSTEPKLAPMPTDLTYEKVGKVHCYSGGLIPHSFEGTNKINVENNVRELYPRIYGDMRQTYMCELVSQIITGEIPEEMSFRQCEWGRTYEDEARAHLELDLGIDVTVPAFIYRDEIKRFGISPDGLVTGLYKGKKTGVELKAPFTTKVFVEFATCEKIKQMYIDQCQYSIWCTDYDQWIFANYDPRIINEDKRLHHVIIQRDPVYMAKYDAAEKTFIRDMDIMLDKMGAVFGQQWAS